MKRMPLVIAVLTAAILSLAAGAAPTAVLVDTSRSIPPAQFDAAKGLVAEALPSLLARGPVALYAFNDEAVQVVDFTQDLGALAEGLRNLRPGGRYTLLHDCVFTAVQAIQAKGSEGVVLLISDGRDENSAVTLEDGASRAAEAHVALVAVGVGAAEERTLRRMAALTGGRYAGRIQDLTARDLGVSFEAAAASLVPVKVPEPPPPPRPAPEEERPAPKAAADPRLFWFVVLAAAVGLLVLAAIAAAVFLLLRRTSPPPERVCEQCGRELKMWESECPDCLASKLAITKPGDETQSPAAPSVPEIDPALLQKAPSSEMLDHTLVLDEVPVLVLRRGNNPPRAFQIPSGQVVSVGRDKINTISVADQTLSGQHFRIVPKEGAFYLVDLKSTNGTYLNGERVTLKELKPDGVIHAGQCDFTFRLEQRRLN
ncbi:MAG: FHA domain-containing protein [Acidobacteriota bacterium]